MTTPRSRPALLALATLAALAASPARRPDPEEWMRQANDALRRQDYSRAIALYEEVEPYATDPGLVAFNLATAKYQLAASGDGGPQVLADAEQLYRCCTEPGEPRRARALYGL